jgi:glycerophosphoryl diester phosphodiesterase
VSRPLIVAHGGANSPERLAEARAHADVVEADVRLFHRRLDVRHAKSLGPLPIFWDHGRLVARGTPRVALDEVLDGVDEDLALMLDLKGYDPRMVREILAATRDWRLRRPVFMSARAWRIADRIAGAQGVTVLHSVGAPRQLRRLLRRYGPGSMEGVSVHRRLLDAAAVGALRERASHLWSWPVDDPETGARLAGWGVTGLISDAPQRLAALRGDARSGRRRA